MRSDTIEFASNVTALGTRTYGLVKEAEDLCGNVIDNLRTALQDIEGEIDSVLLNNEEVRKWHHEQLADIPNRIDNSLPIRDQALQVFLLRNEIKMAARDLMLDTDCMMILKSRIFS